MAIALGIALGLGSALPARAGERAAPALRPCPGHGTGFVRVPGSDTCLRLSGRVAAGLGAASGPTRRGPADALALGRLSIDTRTDTEAGPVRAFVRMGAGRR